MSRKQIYCTDRSGTVVESVGPDTVLVEFRNDEGWAHAVVPVLATCLLLLHYQPVSA